MRRRESRPVADRALMLLLAGVLAGLAGAARAADQIDVYEFPSAEHEAP